MFTIIVPTHDRPFLLHRTLQSLIQQTFRDFTVIIVSDSSQYIAPYEDLAALPGPYFYVLHNGSPGPAESRNLAINLVETDYALFLDDDDTFAPDHLESLARAVAAARPELLYCSFTVVEEDRMVMPPKILAETTIDIPGVSRESVFVNNVIPNSCLLYSNRVLKSARFDPSLILYEDWDYLLTCLKGCALTYTPLHSVRIHKSYVAGEHNIRRGNSNDAHLIDVTKEIYRRHPAPDERHQLLRWERFRSVGIE
ncbi:MAG: glycosyltransferase [Rhodospirillaceae bacterium]